MLIIGLTGGIASGKTSISDAFAELGVPIVDTDVIARKVVEPGEPGLDQVQDAFGPTVITEDGRLDRNRLRQRVFADPAARRRLEDILHPLIRARVLDVLATLHSPYAIVVVPLLIETGFDDIVDRILVVDTPLENQRKRLARRDGASSQEIEGILAAQATREERIARAHDVLVNDGDLAGLRRNVRQFHQRYLEMAEANRS